VSFGYEREQKIFTGDTKLVTAYLRDSSDNLVDEGDIAGVTFTVLKPGDLATAPTINGTAGSVVGDGQGELLVASAVHDIAGQYKGFAQFTHSGGQMTSVPVSYQVIDIFERVGPQVWDAAVDLCWEKLEDCFDSEIGGPWLRDMTLARFDKDKIADFLPDVIFEINMQQPQTDFAPGSFPYDGDGLPLAGQGLLLHTVRHLMRSYTEQPDQANSPVGFFDRTKYQQAWGNIYTMELDRWLKWLGAYKLRLYNAHSTKLLVASKAGRLLPAPLRSRNIGRGYY
jgi:hypothetical protein